MTWSISLGGDTSSSASAEGDEQALVDALVQVIKDHSDKVTYATGSFTYSGSRDLLAEAGSSVPPASPPAPGGDTGTANPPTGPDAGNPSGGDAGAGTGGSLPPDGQPAQAPTDGTVGDTPTIG